jgi:cytochrome c553
MKLLRLVRSVLWGIFGVRRGADSARDLEGASPATLVMVAVGVGVAIVLTLATLAWVFGPGRTMTPVDAARPTPSVPQTMPSPAVPPVTAGASVPVPAHGALAVPDTIAERVRACDACHGSQTRSTSDGYSPRIAGKPAGYLFNQLTGFRDGRRTYAPMVYLVQYLPDAYLREMAAHYASLHPPYPPPPAITVAEDVLARGRQLVEDGDAARDVPPCKACHGATLYGVEPAIPGLLGLPRDYVNAQLGSWRTGKLRSIAPDCMGEVARRLAPADVIAVSAWLAVQPVPADARALPQAAHPLPLECGSVTNAR